MAQSQFNLSSLSVRKSSALMAICAVVALLTGAFFNITSTIQSTREYRLHTLVGFTAYCMPGFDRSADFFYPLAADLPFRPFSAAKSFIIPMKNFPEFFSHGTPNPNFLECAVSNLSDLPVANVVFALNELDELGTHTKKRLRPLVFALPILPAKTNYTVLVQVANSKGSTTLALDSRLLYTDPLSERNTTYNLLGAGSESFRFLRWAIKRGLRNHKHVT